MVFATLPTMALYLGGGFVGINVNHLKQGLSAPFADQVDHSLAGDGVRDPPHTGGFVDCTTFTSSDSASKTTYYSAITT